MVDSLFYYGLHLLIAKDLSGNLVAAFVWVTSGITLMNEKKRSYGRGGLQNSLEM